MHRCRDQIGRNAGVLLDDRLYGWIVETAFSQQFRRAHVAGHESFRLVRMLGQPFLVADDRGRLNVLHREAGCEPEGNSVSFGLRRQRLANHGRVDRARLERRYRVREGQAPGGRMSSMVRPPVRKGGVQPVFGGAARVDRDLLALEVGDRGDLAVFAVLLRDHERSRNRIALGMTRSDDLHRQALRRAIPECGSDADEGGVEVSSWPSGQPDRRHPGMARARHRDPLRRNSPDPWRRRWARRQ